MFLGGLLIFGGLWIITIYPQFQYIGERISWMLMENYRYHNIQWFVVTFQIYVSYEFHNISILEIPHVFPWKSHEISYRWVCPLWKPPNICICNVPYEWLVGGLEHFLFSHILGIIIPIDFHIFQRGSNHQPDEIILIIDSKPVTSGDVSIVKSSQWFIIHISPIGKSL